jgi:hypothetical protein
VTVSRVQRNTASLREHSQRVFPPFSETPFYRANLTLGDPPVHTFSRAKVVDCVVLVRRCVDKRSEQTFSNRPISSLVPNLLGVVVSIDPSASLPGHNKSLCLPLRRVLVHDERWIHESKTPAPAYHFFPNNLKVVPPTGTAERGAPISHTVKVI